MSRSLHVQYRSSAEPLNDGVTDYVSPFSSVELDNTQSGTRIPVAEAMDVLNASVRVVSNTLDASATYTLQKNSTDTSVVVTVGSGQTGFFSDTSNTASLSAGDYLGWEATAGGTTGQCNVTVMGFETEPDTASNTVTFFGINSSSSDAFTSAGTWFYCPQGQRGESTTESEQQFEMVNSCTAKRMIAMTGVNSWDADVTLVSRVNGADGNMTVTVGASQTGAFEDSSNSDSLSDGDLFNWKITVASGSGTFNLEKLGCNLVSTDDQCYLWVGTDGPGTAVDDGLTRYIALAGEAPSTSTTESDTEYTPQSNVTLSNLVAKIPFNNTPSGTVIRTRKNGGNGNQSITLGSSQTGTFEDTTNTDSLAGGTDTANYQVVTQSGGTRIRFNYIGTLAEVTGVIPSTGISGSLCMLGVGF